MIDKYAILDEKKGWLVNLVVWNGNLDTWQSPNETIFIPIDQVDFASLPQKPEEIE